MILTILFSITIFIFLNKISRNDNNLYNLIAIVSSLISFSSVIISIPLIITKYLFSSKEDKRIASIILHTQKHDLNGKKIIRHLVDEEMAKKMKDISESQNNDVVMMDLVNKTIEMANESLLVDENKQQIN